MTTTIVSLALALATTSAGQCPNCGRSHGGGPVGMGMGVRFGLAQAGRIVPPGPGDGWGFSNGNPDGYGWVNYGTDLPLGANRTAEYYFPRYYAVPPVQAFIPTYYNPYFTRGQRYIPYSGGGGDHPLGGPPIASAALPTNPYNDTLGTGPRVTVPPFTGRIEASPINTGGSGLTP